MLTLEEAKALIEKCLANAEDFLNSAKDIQKAKRNHVAFHLAALALEEIGKASMLVVEIGRPLVEPDEDSDQWPSDRFEDHRKKLFWAIFTPSMDAGLVSPESFNELKDFANEVHWTRLASLYVDPNRETPQSQVSDEHLENLINLVGSRLELEKLRQLKEPNATARELLNWFVTASHDPQLQAFVFGEQSRSKLTELKGDAIQWIGWLRDQIKAAEIAGREIMERELKRSEPTGAYANKPKWKLKTRYFSLTHITRPKQLAKWNDGVVGIKLFPTNDRMELLVEFTLAAKVPVASVWHAGVNMSSMFITALNIGTNGYFWRHRPLSFSSYFDQIVDLENNATVKAEVFSMQLKFQPRGLKFQMLTDVGLVFGHLIRQIKHKPECYSRYLNGVALIAKTDVFGDATTLAFMEFAKVLRTALIYYEDWDGDESTIEDIAPTMILPFFTNDDVLTEFKLLIQAAKAIERKDPPGRTITLDEVFKFKVFCDLYLRHCAQRHVRDEMLRKQSEAASQSGAVS
jgi:AbiV family abortive infection protein